MDAHSGPPAKTVAIFDFDHTLIQGESFWAFLGAVAGWPKTASAMTEALALYGIKRTKDRDDPEIADHRTFIKAHLLNRLLAGRAVSEFTPAIENLRGWMKWKEPVHKALMEHAESGHRIVVASGGLDLYLHELLNDIPVHSIICTQVGVKDGTVTGEMVAGNCVRLRKAELVTEYLAQEGPFAESWGYGNLPHDLPMLELLKHRIIV